MDYYYKRFNTFNTFIAFGLPLLCALVFSLSTNHAWEDWYITYRSSKNLATGYGLVYDHGERVYSFTSPLGTLIPAAIKFIFVSASDDSVLWLFRIIQCCFLGVTGLLLLGMARELRLSKWSFAFLLGMFSVDAKILDFSTNGMETGFLVFFIVLTAYGLVMPLRKSGLVLGVAWAGLMWTRPDGFIYIIALSLGFFVFARAATVNDNGRLALIRTFFFASVMAALLYLPWLVWTWVYYGSFVPHSLTAKGAGLNPVRIADALLFPLTGLTRESALDETFSPAYVAFGGWPHLIGDVSRLISWICCFAWVLPFLRPITRAISLAALVTQLYLSFVTPWAAPWYIPGATLLSVIVLALLLQEITENPYLTRANTLSFLSRGLARFVPLLTIASVLSALLVTICVGYQLHVQQHVIENENRKQIGLWLHDHASSSQDRVFLEPLGYIGFYSNLRMYGFPGQSSPELVAARRALSCLAWNGTGECYAALIAYLKPEWLVLRPVESKMVNMDDPRLLGQVYTLEKTFDVSSELASYSFLPGRGWLQFDQTFLVYKRALAME
jgi:hypothetical protein